MQLKAVGRKPEVVNANLFISISSSGAQYHQSRGFDTSPWVSRPAFEAKIEELFEREFDGKQCQRNGIEQPKVCCLRLPVN
jgi:hypothetical protein